MKITHDDSFDKIAYCLCGRGISFGPMGENIVVGLDEINLESYLALAPQQNWPNLQWPNVFPNLKTPLSDLEDQFYHCRCGRLLWKKAGTNEITVFRKERKKK